MKCERERETERQAQSSVDRGEKFRRNAFPNLEKERKEKEKERGRERERERSEPTEHKKRTN